VKNSLEGLKKIDKFFKILMYCGRSASRVVDEIKCRNFPVEHL